jgi:hypothetical protein
VIPSEAHENQGVSSKFRVFPRSVPGLHPFRLGETGWVLRTKQSLLNAFFSIAITLAVTGCVSDNSFAPLPTASDITGGNVVPSPTPSTNNTISPNVCSAGGLSTQIQYYPTECLVPQSDISAQTMGLELNNGYQISSKVFSISSDDPVNGTALPVSLYIEVSTYIQPDSIIITAYNSAGTATSLLDICDISTYTDGDPTGGKTRPYSDTVLQFRSPLPVGTVRITFDYSGSDSPTYLGVWNLDEFKLALGNSASNPFSKSLSSQFRVLSGAPPSYNDNADPLLPKTSPPYCPAD